MLNKSVARRYAEAFFSIAREAGKVDEYQQELELVVRTVDESELLQEYFAHLLIPAKEKKEVANKIFAGQVSQATMNFISIIIDKKREAYLALITEQYTEMADEQRNILKAEMYSAREIPDADVSELAEKLSVSTGKTVQLKPMVDPSLLGGIKVRIGDQIVDATVAKKLEMLKNAMKQAKIS